MGYFDCRNRHHQHSEPKSPHVTHVPRFFIAPESPESTIIARFTWDSLLNKAAIFRRLYNQKLITTAGFLVFRALWGKCSSSSLASAAGVWRYRHHRPRRFTPAWQRTTAGHTAVRWGCWSRQVIRGDRELGFDVHPGKLTWNLKITCLKRKIIFQTSIFGFHVNFQGCIL